MIPWDVIVGMRHRLVHGYFGMNLDILWKTVQEDMPLLVESLRKVLGGD
ncbi:HepT-like ribonuclease domain-containing protein [Desulfatirhabdium butyrativorans]|nr:HepT-like ribonuclease domain-containing protein [Desulfatirhabdium butyrativorans]